MPVLSYRGQSTHKITIGQSNGDVKKLYNTYLYKPNFYQYNQGLYSTGSRSKNSYYDSMLRNAIFVQGYAALFGGDRYTGNWKQIVAGIGKLYIPYEYTAHRLDRSATTDLSARIKSPIILGNYGSNKNGSMRYLPSKKNPKIVDLYPHTLLTTIMQGKNYGGVNNVLKNDIIRIAANQLPKYLNKHEKYFLDENDNLRSMEVWKEYQKTGVLNLGQIYYPPELDDYWGWGYKVFPTDFRRQCANFGYYSINRLEKVYEDNPQAASNYLNAYLKLHGLDSETREYYDIELEEKTYAAEYVFSDIFTKIFGNFNEETFTFTYKNKTYRIDENTKILYDENNEEVLYIKMDDGSYFSTSFEKAIVRALKDEIKPYINSFIEFLKNKPTDIISMRGNTFYQWYNADTTYQVETGDAEGLTNRSTWIEVNKYAEYGYTRLQTNDMINKLNGLYMSPNRLDISKLISINTDYSFSYTLLSKVADDIGNASYENSVVTPILMPNYIDYYTNVGKKYDSGISGYPKWNANQLLTPSTFAGYTYCPYITSLKKFYGDTFIGYNHSFESEHYAYHPNTTALNSVLDNYLGYEGEGENIVFKTDSNGNTLYDENGFPIVDGEKTTYANEVDKNCNLPLPERIYGILTKYPYLIDLENIYLEQSNAYTHTITFNELNRKNRKIVDSSLKDNMGNTLQNYEIEVEPMFQVKEIKYNMGFLPYYKQTFVKDGSSSSQNIEYLHGYKFSPLFYVFDTTDFNMHLWRDIPQTKKYKFIFMKDIIDELEKVGNNYVEVKYSYNENGIKYDKSIDIDGDIDSIKLNFSGNKVSYKMVQYCPQVLMAVGSDRLTTIKRTSYVYQNGIGLQAIMPLVVIYLTAAKWLGLEKQAWKLWDKYLSKFLLSRNVDMHTIGYVYKQEGDFFYNIGNRWEWIYNKNNGNRTDLWDKFENPSYSMEVQDRKNEKRIKKNPSAARIFTDRDFKARKTRYDKYINAEIPIGLEYQERMFITSSFTEDELKAKIGSNTRFKGNLTDKENKINNNRKTFTDEYNVYFESEYPMNITHIYYGQKFCLTWMLNGTLRKVQSLLQSAYIYLDYLCGIKGIINGEKYVPVIIPSRMQFQGFKKNIRIGRAPLTDSDIAELGDKNYKLSIVMNKFWVLNKKTKIKVMIDFKSYIPDYQSHYSTNNNTTNIKTSLLPEVKEIYNGTSTNTSWNTWYKNNINEISHNGDYSSLIKASDDLLGTMEDFMREYLAGLTSDELLKIYNEDNNTQYKYVVNTAYSSNNTLDCNGEINQFVESQVDDNSIVTTKNFVLSKIKEGIINIQWKEFYTTPDGNGNSYKYYAFSSSLNNERITYDVRTLCLGYQIALEKIMQGKSEIEDENFADMFYTYLDANEETISKTTIINHIIKNLQDVIPSNMIITLDEMRDILSTSNKYTQLFDLDPLNVNSISYNLWLRYYVGPNDIKDKLLELQEELVSWKVLLEKNLNITRDTENANNCICSMLPMYQDVWRKMPYNAKLFYSQFSFTYDMYVETFVPQKMGGYDAKLVRTALIWRGLFLQFLLVVVAIVIAILAIITAPFSGGNSIWAAFLIIGAILSVASAALLTVSFICSAIGAYSSNPATQRRMRNLAKSFSQASSIVGALSAVFNIVGNIGTALEEAAKKGVELTTWQLIKEISFGVMQALSATAGIVTSTTDNDSVRKTWSIIGATAAIIGVGLKANATKTDNSGKEVLDMAKTIQNYLNIINQIIALTNQILCHIYSGKLQDIQKEIENLQKLNKELEETLEEEEIELLASPVAMLAALNSKKPLNLEQYEDFPNLMLSQNSLPSSDVDEIIEAQFEVLES